MSNELVEIEDASVFDGLDTNTIVKTAKSYPRKIIKFIEETIKLVTQDIETAESCFYRITQSEGPSVRLAEIVSYTWGNMHAIKRCIKNDGKFVTGQGIAWDFERNQGATVEVQRSITNSSGHAYNYDLQAKTSNAAASIAYRNAVFTVVPKIFVDPIWKKAKEFALSDIKDVQVRLKKTISRFNEYGIDTKQILTYFHKKSIDDLDINDIAEIFSTANAIKYKLIEVNQSFLIKEEKEVILPNDDEHIKKLFK